MKAPKAPMTKPLRSTSAMLRGRPKGARRASLASLRIVSAGLLLTLAFAAQSSLLSLHAHATSRAPGSAGEAVGFFVAADDRAIDSSDGHCQTCEVVRRLGADGRALVAGTPAVEPILVEQGPARSIVPSVPTRTHVGQPSRGPPLASA